MKIIGTKIKCDNCRTRLEVHSRDYKQTIHRDTHTVETYVICPVCKQKIFIKSQKRY